MTKKLLKNLITIKSSFLYKKKILTKLRYMHYNNIIYIIYIIQNNICINVFGYDNRLVFPTYISDQKFKDSMNLLLLINNDKSHYMYIKDFDRFMFHKTKNKNKKWFCKSCLQCFSSENIFIKHKENF